MKMKKYFTLFFLLIISLCGWSFELKDGDLLFQVGKGSDFERAVAAATQGLDGAAFTHVGIVEMQKEQAFVWEASPQGGVRRVPLADFLSDAALIEGKAAVEVFRFKDLPRKQLRRALKRVHKLQGKEYDFLFQPANDAYYCSELVQAVFLDKQSQPLFPSAPMSFADKQTGRISPLWRAYFQRRGAAVPQGVAGTNPGDMSKSALLKRVHRYY